MNKKLNNAKSDFNFSATGIGSVPSIDIKETCLRILKQVPDIPFWPQFVRRSPLEDMSIQFSEGLPLLEIIKDRRTLALSSGDMESEFVTFYDNFMAEDIDYFATSREFAPGLYELVDLIRQDPEKYGPYIKGQIVGPVTFASGIAGHDGKSILHNPDLKEAMTKGLAIKALWQLKKLGESGKKPILFLDEPALSGFGSAFSPIQRHEVISMIKEILDYLRERSDSLIGIHCCGNTDWSMIIETGIDIINFDAFSYMEYFLLYPEEIAQFLKDGGTIAWGIIPTADFTGKESVKDLFLKLEEGLNHIYEWGLDSETVEANSILTPACGMGTMGQDSADRVLDLLSMLSKKCGSR